MESSPASAPSSPSAARKDLPKRRSVSDLAKRLVNSTRRTLSKSSSSNNLPEFEENKQQTQSLDIAQSFSEVESKNSSSSSTTTTTQHQQNQLNNSNGSGGNSLSKSPSQSSPPLLKISPSQSKQSSANEDPALAEMDKDAPKFQTPSVPRAKSPTQKQNKILGQNVEKVIPFQSDKHAKLSSMVVMNESTKLFFDSMDNTAKRSELKEKDEEGNTPLHWACFLGQLDVVRLLVSNGIKLNEKNNKGATPLHSACCKVSGFHAKCAELLIHHGANVNAKNNVKETALHYCSAKAANIPATRVLLKAHAQTDIKDHKGRTPLHWAARYGHLALCNLLISEGSANIDVTDEDQMTPLSLAVAAGQQEVVALLLIRGSKLTGFAIDGTTVVHQACKYGRVQILEMVLSQIRKKRNEEHFRLLYHKDNHGFTPAHWAILSGSTGCLQQFPNFVDVPDNIGLSPLFWAALRGNRTSIHYILSKSPNLLHPVFGKTTTSFLYPLEDDYFPAINNPQFADIRIQCEETTFLAHKVVVIRCLKNIITDSQLSFIKFPDMSPRHFQDFLTYMYTGRIPKKPQDVLPLLQIANNLGLPILRQLCENSFLERLKATSRVSTLPLHFSSILESAQFSDLKIFVEARPFSLHKLILFSRGGPFLRNLVVEHVKDDHVSLDGVNKHTFKAIMEYVYTDAIKSSSTLHAKEIEDVLEVAQKWEITRLAVLCEYYLYERVTAENVCDYLTKPYKTLYNACLDLAAAHYKDLKKKHLITVLPANIISDVKKKKKELKEKATEEKKGPASKDTSWFRTLHRRSLNISIGMAQNADGYSLAKLEQRYGQIRYEDPSTVTPDTFFAGRPDESENNNNLGGRVRKQ